MRQVDDQRYSFSDTYDWIICLDWFSSYQIFSKVLAEKLAQMDGIDLEKARSIVKQAFWFYLSQSLTGNYEDHYKMDIEINLQQHIENIFKNIVKSNKYLSSIFYSARAKLSHADDMSLKMLLNPRSPYHKDFMPIYHVVTNGEKNKVD